LIRYIGVCELIDFLQRRPYGICNSIGAFSAMGGKLESPNGDSNLHDSSAKSLSFGFWGDGGVRLGGQARPWPGWRDYITRIALSRSGRIFRNPYIRKISTLCLDSGWVRRWEGKNYTVWFSALLSTIGQEGPACSQSSFAPLRMTDAEDGGLLLMIIQALPYHSESKPPATNEAFPGLNQWPGKACLEKGVI